MYQIEPSLENDFPVSLDGMPVDDIWEDQWDQLTSFVETGETSDEFWEQFIEDLENNWDGSAPYLHVELLSKEQYEQLDLTSENVFKRVDWEERCGDELDIKKEQFGFSTWKWGKLRFIMSGFVDHIG